jgi:hypothetical protein
MSARPVGPGFFPLAERLALVPGQLSPALAALAVRFGLTCPFQRAAKLLTAACGTRVSPDTVRRLTEAAGDAWWQLELPLITDLETAARTPFAAPVAIPDAQLLPPAQAAILELDGAMVPLVHGEWAEARTLVIGTQAGETTTALSYVSQVAPAATFARTILPELMRRGVDAHPGPVVALSDGAIWIQELLDLHCPQAVRVLDIMHAAGYLAQAAQASFGPGTATTSEWFATARAALRRGDADTTLAMLATLPASPERDSAIHYLGQRRAMLAYARCDAEGWPVGSGAVESANKQVVAARLKGAGMHWTRSHANAVLALSALEASDRWATTWPRIVRRWRQTHPTRAAARRAARVPSGPAARPVVASPTAPATAPTPAPRPKTIVDGKPTAAHPWNQGRPRLPMPSS